MTALPAGLGVCDVVVLPHHAVPGSDFHRPACLPTVTGCGRDRVELTSVMAALAVGLGCRPCADCFPPAVPPLPGGLPLRPASPWPGKGAGYRSRQFTNAYQASRVRPAVPASILQGLRP